MKKDLGYNDAPVLEQLLIQQAVLCWLKLNLVELSYSGTMKHRSPDTAHVLGETIECCSTPIH